MNWETRQPSHSPRHTSELNVRLFFLFLGFKHKFSFLILIPFLVFALLIPSLAARNSSLSEVAADHYQKAVQLRTALEARPQRQRSAVEYIKVINEFRAVYRTTPSSSKSDDALMAIAELYQAMAADLKDGIYFSSATKTYEFLQKEYPGSPFCVQAAFATAEIQLNDLHDLAGAQETYTALLKKYPKSKQARFAKARLDDLRAQLKAPPKAEPTPQPSQPVVVASNKPVAEPAESDSKKKGMAVPASPAKVPIENSKSAPPGKAKQPEAEPAWVKDLRFWSTAQYTRVVVSLSRETDCSDSQMSNPDRIFMDLPSATLARELDKAAFSLEGGPLRRIRLWQRSDGSTRIVLEAEKIKSYRVVSLKNPFRIVVDVEGPAKTADPAQAGKSKQEVTKRGKPRQDELAADIGLPVTEMAAARNAASPSKEAAKTSPGANSKGKANGSVAVAEKKESPPKNGAQETASQKYSTPAPDKGKSSGTEEPAEVASLSPPPGKAKKNATEPETLSEPGTSRVANPKSDGTRSLIRTLGLKIGKIVIDPGHGGHDTGTIGPGGLKEKDLVLDIAMKLKTLIEEKLGGEVIMTRTDDTFIPLEERTEIANRNQADLFISIHANSSRDKKARGIETFFLNFATSEDVEEVAARENATSQKTIFELQDLIQKIALKEKIDESREFAHVVQQ